MQKGGEAKGTSQGSGRGIIFKPSWEQGLCGHMGLLRVVLCLSLLRPKDVVKGSEY